MIAATCIVPAAYRVWAWPEQFPALPHRGDIVQSLPDKEGKYAELVVSKIVHTSGRDDGFVIQAMVELHLAPATLTG